MCIKALLSAEPSFGVSQRVISGKLKPLQFPARAPISTSGGTACRFVNVITDRARTVRFVPVYPALQARGFEKSCSVTSWFASRCAGDSSTEEVTTFIIPSLIYALIQHNLSSTFPLAVPLPASYDNCP